VREIVCTSSSAAETKEIAAELATALVAGDVVALSGDLGAGKTCFVQGAAHVLGVRSRVTSPSFVLVREYTGSIRIAHVDVYRLDSLQELIDLGYEELFDPDVLVFIEWGDAVSGLLPDDRIEVELLLETEEKRRITLRANGPLWEARLDSVGARLQRWAVGA
jgi:tRNA threonylcarbamoyladenosine biosynthesis protein TsaE